MEAASPVLYRPYRDADVDQVARVWLDSWRSTGISASNHVSEASNRERIIREIASGWRVTVAAHANSIVAFLAIKPTEKVLDQLFVTPSFQVIGIGLALLQTAKEQMPDGFWLRTAADNHAARRFYESHGLAFDRLEAHPVLGHQTAIYIWR